MRTPITILAGSLLQIEPKCFDSGYKPAEKVIPLKFNLNDQEFQIVAATFRLRCFAQVKTCGYLMSLPKAT